LLFSPGYGIIKRKEICTVRTRPAGLADIAEKTGAAAGWGSSKVRAAIPYRTVFLEFQRVSLEKAVFHRRKAALSEYGRIIKKCQNMYLSPAVLYPDWERELLLHLWDDC
jgi:hypothetical protein